MFTAVQLLIAIVLLIVASPFLADLPGGQGIEATLMTGVLVSAVFVVGRRRRAFWPDLLLAAPAVITRWLHHFRPDLMPESIYFVAALGFLAFVIVRLLNFVLGAPQVDSEVLCASVAAYLLLGLVWTLAYALVAQLNPNAFSFNVSGAPDHNMSGFNSLYFSFVTLSTVGYGDITPISRVARMLAATEAMTGMLYVAVLIARLVSLYSSPKSNDS